jgi:hypothetical protein
MKRLSSIVALVAAAAIVAAAVAGAAVSRASITVSPKTVERGHAVVVRGSAAGCPRGDAVTLISHAFVHTHDFAGVPAVYARVRATGRFSVTTRIPGTRHPARYTITGRCGGGNLGVAAHLTVHT